MTNKSGAAKMATHARRGYAAMKRGRKRIAAMAACAHEHTEIVTGDWMGDWMGDPYELEHCLDCDSYGPWAGKETTT